MPISTLKGAQHHSLLIRKMQMKTTMRYHFTPTKMTIIKMMDNKKHC